MANKMLIYIGADHRGFKLKESLKVYLKESGYEVVDVGNNKYDENDDYPDFASAAARKVSLDPENSRGILICGSGVGMDVAANKYKNIRSALVTTPDQAAISRHDDNANVLSLAADFLTESEAKKILTVWLQTDFSEEERHRRRLEKIEKIEAP
jgi:ribose 5-phosphate isomerase B